MGKIDGGLRALFRKNLPSFDWCSIESGTTMLGIPDSNYCAPPGREGWIEYKIAHGHAVTLRPAQIRWIARRVRNGGRVWIAVRQQAPAGPRREARDVLWLIPGRDAKVARIEGLRGADGDHGWSCWQGGPARWRWDLVAVALVA